jgi:non-ribosomal peptide synthase protein (TIGR01720 family)
VALTNDRRFAGGGHARVLLHSPHAFDASTYELWVPLLNGGEVVVAPTGDLDPATLRQVLRRTGVTGLWLTAGLFRLLVQEDPECLAGVREVWTGGDVVPAAAVGRALATCPGLTVVDGYGPTETTTFAATYPMPPGAEVPDTVPIGRPLDGMALYILDSDLQPVPVGVPGELYIAGHGLARGYLNRPGLTADRFVANPFGGPAERGASSTPPNPGSGRARPGARMYRTGDSVRWRADGCVEFLGRLDEQVKLRGFRIELGEIEAAVRRHPEIRECVVSVQPAPAGPKHLVAYVVPAPGTGELDTTAIGGYLSGILPDYMVPTAYVSLAALPLSTNGKVDRQALPQPQERVGAPEQQAPSGPVQEALAAVWADVLGVPRVGARDNFFELGGDSILSIQVVSRARQAGLRFTTRDLFVHQTIAELAPVVTEVQDTGAGEETVVGEAPLTPIQHWFFATQRANHHHFNQSLLLELTDEVDEDALRAAVDALVTHHDALRMRFGRTGERWWQDNPAGDGGTVLARHDLSDVDDAGEFAAMEKIADDVHGSFDLACGPLLRAVLFDTGAGRRDYLLLVAHHLVVDGVSWRILLDDLETGYRQAGGGQRVHLGGKTTSYRDWARRLAEHVGAGKLDHEREHWAGALAGCAPLIGEAPGPAPEAEPGSTGVVTVRLAPEDSDALLRAAPTAYRTRINDVLLAALAWALTRGTGRDRVAIQLEGHGREDVLDGVDLSRTVGWFTTIFPVALDVPGGPEPDWRALAKSVRRQLRAVPGNGLGFGALRYLGAPAGEVPVGGGAADPQIVFNYLGQWDAQASDEGGALVRAVHTALGQEYKPADRDSCPLEVVGAVEGGELGFTWFYQLDRIDESTVERLAGGFAEALRRIAHDCRKGPR